MPVGVPKVPFLIPKAKEASWVDVYNRLYRQRFLFLGQEIDRVISNQLVGLIVFLNIENKKKEIFLYLNCPGGWILPGFGLVGTMQTVKPDVNTICIGVAVSIGSFILLGGTATKRLAFEHAKIMMYQPFSSFFKLAPRDGRLELSLLLDAHQKIVRAYVRKTGQTPWAVSRDLKKPFL
ncbi:hypothetical protein AQUCO_04400094v1 [Aquilegia coerulea]|uniref:ATP-dependent Clp protease proteolytic subunit n=1 Tax=Aquilegia coerulea TaxID=218851 RepID=A0A2G5CMZ1_AQUCA|nr:hypothetical protein AQUCO_04400094v1 [Aquilegia coerulea]